MTGFGTSEKNGFRVEVRSLNHRFLDISVKMNSLLAGHEMQFRSTLKSRFSRGKIDVTATISGSGGTRLKLNTGLAREIYKTVNTLKSELSIPGEIGIETLLKYKELFIADEPEVDTISLEEAFNEAVSQLEKMRIDEGKATAEDVLKRADKLKALRETILAVIPEVISEFRSRFEQRLKELLGGAEFDNSRVLQEVAVMAEKTDISEELARIENHLSQFKKIFIDGDTIGKRLDFILQELNREANTIASKTGDTRVSNIVIEMKSEIEKMREQVQNIQ